MNIEELIAEIIPPNDYQHRNGFSNVQLIDQLTNEERELVEDALIYKLIENTDMLIVETLGYMRSEKSLPILNNMLEECSDNMRKIIIATSIFVIDRDNAMINVSINAFKHLDNIYQQISAFYYLKKFESPQTDSLIGEYTEHSNYLLSYNAKQALGKIA